jgi:hypothetical protein
MHNTPEQNARFQRQWCETNLRYLLGEEHPTQETLQAIEMNKAEIARLDLVISEMEAG